MSIISPQLQHFLNFRYDTSMAATTITPTLHPLLQRIHASTRIPNAILTYGENEQTLLNQFMTFSNQLMIAPVTFLRMMTKNLSNLQQILFLFDQKQQLRSTPLNKSRSALNMADPMALLHCDFTQLPQNHNICCKCHVKKH